MIKSIKQKYLVCLFLIGYIDCHTFNQTRSIHRKIIGVNEISIKQILKIEKTSLSEIRINTIATLKDGSPVDEPMCILISYDSDFKEFKYSQFKSNIIILEKCIPIDNTELLDYKIIRHSEHLKNIEQQNKKSKIESIVQPYMDINNNLFIPLGYDLVIVGTKLGIQSIFRKYSDKVKKTIYMKPNKYYYLLYPIALPYDLLAGTLNTVGRPFYYACEFGFGLGLRNRPSNFFENAFMWTVLYTTCPIGGILTYPDGVYVKPDIFDEYK
ncbi:hypothetical protein NUH30_19575 [Leptospira sp. 85282-16]|uniref:hypothetical protein n=1 Tax=Leptospira sp. 85282-16 TaxID=2971256 RepID=UPI0021C1E14D|nr:hypothetical protein [Leptospira sp. 85282-16]MCT8335897.1 hypothetical protein [Leptospira sp. 85282-16]